MNDALIVRKSDGAVVDGAPWLFKAVSDQTDGAFDFMVGTVEPFTGPPLHVHAEQTDTFYVLEGTLTVQVHDEIVDLEPGDFVSIPPGNPHTFDNIYPDRPRTRAVNLMTPAGLHSFFVDRSKAGSDAKPDVVRGIAQEHGVTTVGDPLRTRLGLG